MTDHETPIPDSLGVIAAFLDGADVDGSSLKQALATDEGRDYLVDLLSLRRAVVAMGPIAFPTPVSAKGRVVRFAGAAAVALVALAAGYFAGAHGRPPTGVTDVLTKVEAGTDVSAPARAPEPTYVIRLEPDGSWTGPARK